jgi:hypothetical protein
MKLCGEVIRIEIELEKGLRLKSNMSTLRLAFCTLRLALCMLLILSAASTGVAQRGQSPAVARRVRPEQRRDAKLEAAIVAALYADDEGGVKRDGVRYYYNRVDLNGDGRPEALVFVFGPAWCGSAGCAALVFRTDGSGYDLVSQVSGVENPVFVGERKTNGWSDLIAHVRWGEVSGETLRDYYAVLRFDGRTYPEQFPGEPPLDAKKRMKVTAYLIGNQSDASGLALRPARGRTTKAVRRMTKERRRQVSQSRGRPTKADGLLRS